MRVLLTIVLAALAFAAGPATAAGARAPDDGGPREATTSFRDWLYTYRECTVRWSDAPIDTVTATGPGRVRVTGTIQPCQTYATRPGDSLVVVAGTATSTGTPITFVYYVDAHPFGVEVALPVGTTRVCTSTAPGILARCFAARVDALPDGSPAVPVVGGDLGIRPPKVTRDGTPPNPHCGGCW